MLSFRLQHDSFGKLLLIDASGESYSDVTAVRAFPISDPHRWISLLDADGHEIYWIEHLSDLSDEQASLINEELAGREFVPEILRIVEVSSFATPSSWTVVTDRGLSEFVLKGEEDIRRLKQSTLLIADRTGIQYLIRNLHGLDRHSRRLLDRFL